MFSKFPSYVLFVSLFNSFYGYFKNLSLCYFVWLECLTWSSRMFDWLNSQLSSEGKLYSSIVPYFFPTIALHIEITPLVDRTYELIQEPDGDISEAQANVVELTEAPNSDSEEPKSTDSIDTNIGQPRYILPLFLNYADQYYFLVHLRYWSWMKT